MKSFRLSPNAFVLVLAALLAALPARAAETRPAPQPATTQASTQPASAPANRWEPNIVRFEEQDAAKPPPQNAILFVGSSSIAMWDTKKYFPDLHDDPARVRRLADRRTRSTTPSALSCPPPAVLVFYAGDNDIAAGRPPQQLLADFQAFVAKVHPALPRDANRLHRHQAQHRPLEPRRPGPPGQRPDRGVHEDRPELFLPRRGQPRRSARTASPAREFFKPDGLHLNHDGYVLWSSLLRPYLGEEPPAKAAVDWLTPRIVTCRRGGWVAVAARVTATRQGGLAGHARGHHAERSVAYPRRPGPASTVTPTPRSAPAS